MKLIVVSLLIPFLLVGIQTHSITEEFKTCVEPRDCPVSDACIACQDGKWPDCEIPTCIDGKCGVIKSCSNLPNTTTTEKAPCNLITETITTPTNQCTQDDLSNCRVPIKCAKCLAGYRPGCTEISCVDGQCKVIEPCSIKPQCTVDDTSRCPTPRIACRECDPGTSPSCPQAECVDGQCQVVLPCTRTETTTESPTTPEPDPLCEADKDCKVQKKCVKSCKPGYGPLCAKAKCVAGKCLTIKSCSKKVQCTPKNTTQCPKLRIACRTCAPGRFPSCPGAICVDGECQSILPCSRTNNGTKPCSKKPKHPSKKTSKKPKHPWKKTSKKTKAPCKKDCDCKVGKKCVLKCKSGYGPLCAKAKCVDGFCKVIAPCSRPNNGTKPCSKKPKHPSKKTSKKPKHPWKKTSKKSKVPCKKDCDCKVGKGCVLKCKSGYGPLCPKGKCVGGFCKVIAPCSQRNNGTTLITKVPTTTKKMKKDCPADNDD